MPEKYGPPSSMLGMKSRRRAQLMAITREREAKKAALVEDCVQSCPLLSAVPAHAPQSNNGGNRDTPFDELMGVESANFAFDEPAAEIDRVKPYSSCARRAQNSRAVSSDLQGEGPQMFSPSRTVGTNSSMRLRGREVGAAFDEEQRRRSTYLDSVNFSSLVVFRENEQRLDYRNFKDHKHTALSNVGRRLSSCRDRVPLDPRVERSTRASPDIYRDLLVPQADIKSKAIARIERSIPNFRFRTKSTSPLQMARNSKGLQRIMDPSFSMKESFDLPSDEEIDAPRFDEQILPSLDVGDSMSVSSLDQPRWSSSRLTDIFKVASTRKSRLNATSSIVPPTHMTSLATEVSRFMLMRKIVARAGRPERCKEVGLWSDKSTSSCLLKDSMRSDTQEHLKDLVYDGAIRSSPDELVALKEIMAPQIPSKIALSVAVLTSKRIMKTLHSPSTHSSVENVVVWSSSRDINAGRNHDRQNHREDCSSVGEAVSVMPSSSNVPLQTTRQSGSERLESIGDPYNDSHDILGSTVPQVTISTTISSLGGSISTHETIQNRESLMDTVGEGTEDDSMISSFLQPSVSIDGSKVVWKFYQPDDNVIPPPPFAGKAKKDREEAKVEPKKTLFSFYDPHEIEALVSSTSVEPYSMKKEKHYDSRKKGLAPWITPVTAFDVEMRDQRSAYTQTLQDDPDNSCSDLPTISSDFSFSHLLSPNEIEDDDVDSASLQLSVGKILEKLGDLGLPKQETIVNHRSQSPAKCPTDEEIVQCHGLLSKRIQSNDEQLPSSASSGSSTGISVDVPSFSLDSESEESILSQDSTMVSEPDEVDIPPHVEQTEGDIVLEEKCNHHFTNSMTPKYPSGSLHDQLQRVSSPIKTVTVENRWDTCNDTVPDYAINQVVGLMDRFNVEQQKNRHIFRFMDRTMRVQPSETTSGHDKPKAVCALETSPKNEVPRVDRYSSHEDMEYQDTKSTQSEHDSDYLEAEQLFSSDQLQKPKASEIAEKGRHTSGLVLEGPSNSQAPEDKVDEQPSIDGTHPIQTGIQMGLKQTQLDDSFTSHSGADRASVSHINMFQEAFPYLDIETSKSAAESRMGSIIRSVESDNRSDDYTEHTLATLMSSSRSKFSRSFSTYGQTAGNPSDEDQSTLVSSAGSMSLISSFSESMTASKSLSTRDDLALSTKRGINSFALRGPATNQMLKLFSLNGRGYPNTISELVRKQGLFCKCAAASFED